MNYRLCNIILCGLLATVVGRAQVQTQPLPFGRTFSLPSKILGETRTINIYLPDDYQAEDTVSYPLMVLPDGGVDEDFFHIAGIVRFNNQPWINRFPKSILVGIENTNRRRDFTFAVKNLDFLEAVGFKKEDVPHYGGSEKYISFLKQELIPYLEKNYRIRKQRTLMGESLAGLLSTEILLKHPELFDTYLIVSPSLWWGDELLLKQADKLLKKNLKKQVRVCVSAPAKEEDEMMYREAETLYQTLRKNPQITCHFDYLPDALHSTVFHEAVYHALKILYPKTEDSK